MNISMSRRAPHADATLASSNWSFGNCAKPVLLSASAAKPRKQQPSSDCIVTVTLSDGSTEPRDCYVMDASSKDLQPGTKARFESCTQ